MLSPADFCHPYEAVHNKEAVFMPDTLKRSLIAVPALALLVSFIGLHGIYAKIVTVLVGTLCVHEMMNAASKVARPMRAVGYAFAVLLCPAYEYAGGQTGVTILLTLCVMVVFTVLVFSGRNMADGFFTILTMTYPGLFLASMLGIVCTPAIMVKRKMRERDEYVNSNCGF